jgi:hypothetical protein
MSRETSFCSVYSLSTETPLYPGQKKPYSGAHVIRDAPLPRSKETSLSSAHFNRDFPYSCQMKPYSALHMSIENPLTHVKRNITLLCPCHQRLALLMSKETLLCSAHVIRDAPYPGQKKPYFALPRTTEIPFTHVKRNLPLLFPCQQRLLFHLPTPRETLLCFAPVRDSPYPHQEKPHSALSMSTDTNLSLAQFKRNLNLLCPCQRLLLSISKETSLCSVHVNRHYPSPCPFQEKPYSALLCQRLPLPKSRETSLCSAHVNRDSLYPCQEKPHSALPMSTETPFTHVKRNLTLLCLAHVMRNLILICPCQHRLPLPMSRETPLCSVHVNIESPCPC